MCRRLKCCKKNTRTVAFSLAEVLITLGIIGVVAAITLPIIVGKIQKKVYINQLKVGYSILNSGFKQMMFEDSAFEWSDTALYSAIESNGGNLTVKNAEEAAKNIIEKYFKNIEFVDYEHLFEGSSCSILVKTGAYAYGLKDQKTCYGSSNGSQYSFPNGMIMNISLYAPCTSSSKTDEQIRAAGGKMYKDCGNITLDINGKKKPNTYGRDVFKFEITEKGIIIPRYGIDQFIYAGTFNRNTIKNTNMSNCSIQSTGLQCAARIIDWLGYEILTIRFNN